MPDCSVPNIAKKIILKKAIKNPDNPIDFKK
jgi:hypothetical protein